MNRYFLTVVFVLVACVQGLCSEAFFAESINGGDKVLVRSGIGALSRWFIKGCDIALYAEKDAKKSEILNDIPKCLEFYYYRTIKAEQFAVAAWDTLNKSWSEERLKKEKSNIERMHTLFRTVNKGDRYRLIYLPDTGTSIFLNGNFLGIIEGAEFAEVYYSIWLGKTPIDLKTRDKMLEGLK